MSTSVTTTRNADRDAQLDAEGKRHMADLRAKRALIVAITQESWGKAMTDRMRAAFAAYMQRFHLDISEVDNLGGKPYKNGYYYRRRVAEMRTKGLVEWSEGEHIGPDARLDALEAAGDEWAKAENMRRTRARIMWAVPADATHAYVTRVKLRSDDKPLEGCDFITPLRTKKVRDWDNKQAITFKQVPADPVGADEPEKTVITRSWRRVGLLVAAEIPELRQEEDIMDVEAEAVQTDVHEMKTEDKAHELANAIVPKAIAASSEPSDPYGVSGDAAAQKGKAQPVAAAPSAAPKAKAAEPELFGRSGVDVRPEMTDEELDDLRFRDEDEG